ncbi:MAG: DNA primase, partial [Anaerovoracaceae bacterium]
AISKLAEECGVVLENHYDRNEKKDEYYEINRAAARFFYRALRETQNKGLAYVEKRGLSRDTLQKFGIGYADPKWDSLYNHLTGLGFSKEKLLELGLISLSKGKYYDKFRDRVIFPIQNTGGKVIGFGGRALGEDGPKYLNSPETPVFHKKNNLYGLNLTRSEIGREDCGILVEGYMDVVSLYQHGVRNVSASLGTALTENQAKLLKRYSHHIVLAYDADAAGVDAALRGMDILHQEACKVRVLHISDGKDPDDFIKKHGKDAFLSLIGEALPYADYKFQWIKSQKDMTSTEGRVSFLQEAVTVLRRLSPVELRNYPQNMVFLRVPFVQSWEIRRKNPGKAILLMGRLKFRK